MEYKKVNINIEVTFPSHYPALPQKVVLDYRKNPAQVLGFVAQYRLKTESNADHAHHVSEVVEQLLSDLNLQV